MSATLLLRWPRCMATVTTGHVLLVLLAMSSVSWAIQCYQCGAYIPVDEVNKTPRLYSCDNFNASRDLRECRSVDTACMKYEVRGNLVLKCSQDCREDFDAWNERTISCCDTDACNASEMSLASRFVSIVALVTLVFGCLTTTIF